MKKIIKQCSLMFAGAMTSQFVAAQTLEVAVNASPAGLDTHIVTAFSSTQIVKDTIYEGLTKVDQDLRIIPGLARSWNISEDGRTYIFNLVKNAKFHNGKPLEALDVVSSFHRVQSKQIGSPIASRITTVSTIKAADPSTVVITLKKPSAPFLTAISSLAIVPRSFEKDKDSLQQTPVGTGPFMFDEWQPNGYILLKKNPSYWKKELPKLDGVKFHIVPESMTRQVGLSSGQYHILPNIDASAAIQLEGQANIQMQQVLELSYTLIGMNVSKPPFNNPKVREALNYALNREQIVQAALFGAGQVGGPLSPALTDWTLDVSQFACYESSSQKAKSLLEEADLKQPVKFTLLVLPFQVTKDIAQIVQAQLSEAGFQVELDIPELGKFVQAWKNSNFDAFISINGGSPDPDGYFYRTFRSDGSTNIFKYKNSQIDQLLDDGRNTVNKSDRQKIYTEIQQKLACSGPIAFMTYGQLFTATSNQVKGFQIQANRSLASFERTYLIK